MYCDQKHFDPPFYTLLPPPPLGLLDPCYQAWVKANRLAVDRASICQQYGKHSKECFLARDRHFKAARQYAFCLDDAWGLNEI
jgi:hypothetical protein